MKTLLNCTVNGEERSVLATRATRCSSCCATGSA